MPATLPANVPAPNPLISMYERSTQAIIINQSTTTVPQASPPAAPAGVKIYGMAPTVARGQLPFQIFLQVDVGGSGSLSALSVDLLGSLDGVNFYKLGTVSAPAGGIFPFSGISARYLTADISTMTVASGTPTVTVSFAA